MARAPRSRAVVQTADETFEVHEFGVPEIGPDAALLRMELCGICGTDIEQYDGRMAEKGYIDGPAIPGHEPLGVIERIGERAAERWGVRAGDRVAVEPIIPCDRCEACRSGNTTRCSGWGRDKGKHGAGYAYGFLTTDIGPELLGGYAEYMYLHPNTRVHPMPRAMPAEVAVLFNPLAAGVRWATTETALKLGDTILITGCGQRGLACVIAARAAGAGQIIVTDLARAQHKLDLASDLGADAVIVADEQDVAEEVRRLTGGRLVDVVVDVTPVATQPLLDAVECVRQGGTIVVAGVKGGPRLTIDTDVLLFRSITLRGVFTVTSEAYREAIRLLTRGGAVGGTPFHRIHTASYPLERAEEAIHHLAGRLDGPPATNVAIRPGASGLD